MIRRLFLGVDRVREALDVAEVGWGRTGARVLSSYKFKLGSADDNNNTQQQITKYNN